MGLATPAYLEVIDFIAGSNPEAIAGFRPSPDVQRRVSDLIDREKTEGLSADDKSELDHFLELEHILRMAKAKAHLILARGI